MKGLFIKKGEVLYKASLPGEELDTTEYKEEDFKDSIFMGYETEDAGDELYVVGNNEEEVQEIINKFFKAHETRKTK